MEKDAKICVLTGASRGIGQGVCAQLKQLPYPVFVVATATGEEGLARIRDTLATHGLQGEACQLNLLEEASIDRFLATLDERKWAPDILINNAGLTKDNLLLRMQDEQWHAVMQANLHATFTLCRYAVKKMMKKKWGRIVNLSSVVGVTGNPGQANYTAAKAGMIAFTKSIAAEFASRNITANCICPGFIDTDASHGISDRSCQCC
jgi:3-oxoacyl-[acyl-carrier protein] reductase